MPVGLEVHSPDGKLTYSSEWGSARVLGSFVTTEGSGTREIFTEDGVPAYDVFAYVFPFRAFQRGLHGWSQAVWTEGNTIHWVRLTVGSTIIFGDGYP